MSLSLVSKSPLRREISGWKNHNSISHEWLESLVEMTSLIVGVSSKSQWNNWSYQAGSPKSISRFKSVDISGLASLAPLSNEGGAWAELAPLSNEGGPKLAPPSNWSAYKAWDGRYQSLQVGRDWKPPYKAWDGGHHSGLFYNLYIRFFEERRALDSCIWKTTAT